MVHRLFRALAVSVFLGSTGQQRGRDPPLEALEKRGDVQPLADGGGRAAGGRGPTYLVQRDKFGPGWKGGLLLLVVPECRQSAVLALPLGVQELFKFLDVMQLLVDVLIPLAGLFLFLTDPRAAAEGVLAGTRAGHNQRFWHRMILLYVL